LSRIIALLSWYNEDPAWLSECVASAARLCDHIIAVDGPYAAFPSALAKPSSGSEQVDAIAHTAAGAGIGCTIHTPRQPWWGGEVQKRDFMFRLGETFTTSEDWYFRIDADETLTNVPSDARRRLEETELDVAEVMIWERETAQKVNDLVDTSLDYRSPFRCLFRALPDIRIEQAHYLVTVPDSRGGRRVLNGDGVVHRNGPAEPLHDMGLEHRTQQRSLGRKQLKQDYYAMVREFGLESIHPFQSGE
jgi:hypothetical protein